MQFLAVQELKDRKKIQFLLATRSLPEDETTYFRDKVSKHHVKIVPAGAAKKKDASRQTGQEEDVVVLEDEIEALRFTTESLKTQLEEQRKSYEDRIAHLLKEKNARVQEENLRRQQDNEKIEGLMNQVHRLRSLCRENTKELLQSKKTLRTRERQAAEEKATSIEEAKALRTQLAEQQEQATMAERTIEEQLTKQNEVLLRELRAQITKNEDELRNVKSKYATMEVSHKRKVDALQRKVDAITTSYLSLKRRRDYEIEGFTNDILNLRKQIKNLERNILKFGPLEDTELTLLSLAKKTGEKVENISTTLTQLKNKVYSTEEAVRSLAF
ncbi:Coiled-coil domain-containing protein 77 [Quaeritorhiza haematococci]|nr:Coiled-coil domain-containing protein 77 [Quaeritorhiza haematococci]